MEINYSGKSALIVDSKLEDLGALRQILSRLGVGQVQAAASVNMALTLMREFTFDLCFASYDMGRDEKNGLQLLQEANAEKIIPKASSYFLIVDPESSELLFGSLENSPDTYISKPFDEAKVRHRLEKQLRIKEAVRPIEKLVDSRQYEAVLDQARDLATHFPGLSIVLQRLSGIALLRMKRFTQAKELFVQLTNNRDLPWAEVGKGVAHFNLGEYEDALKCLNRIVDQQHICVEAYTWLARIYRVRGELGPAVTLMRKAVMIQPTVPALQSELADLACQTGEWAIACSAYQQAVRYARYSSFQDPVHYFGLARALIISNKDKIASVETEVLRVLEDVVLDHPDDPEVMFKAKLVNCDLYRQDATQQRLEQMMQQTYNFFMRMTPGQQCKWLDVMLDAAKGSSVESEVKARWKELHKTMVASEWGKANYTAMTSFRNRDLDKAFMMFGRANELLPAHTGIALNLVQSGIEKAKRGENALWILLSVRDVLATIPFGALSEKQQQRYRTLAERYAEMYRQLNHYGDEDAASSAG
ncbi:tetratricopeptide repeat protein [Neptuniibacter halophilus]|uniref:tetratricopeptide repeat protein n=1 Tax=Neptuniibacter halophilus TaxID=651666 RepID=UPI0025735AC8|nr:tetratricopeptide repeat protein [Neptuniibacter halophilus]